MMKLKPNEVQLRGSWNYMDFAVQADDVCRRIEILVSNYLIHIDEDETGWSQLYQDPEDLRYWELTYPKSEVHGGGPPLLKNLSIEEAKDKYNIKY